MAIGFVNGFVNIPLNILFTKMVEKIPPDPTKPGGVLNQVDAYNAFNIVQNEDPNIIEMLPSYVKDKFANGGLTLDLFNQMDPLGVKDGLINFEEFAAGLNPVGSTVDLGDHQRGGDSGALYGAAGYTVWKDNGKGDAVQTSQNVMVDFENLVQGEPGSTQDGQIDKRELEVVISKYRAAGQDQRARVAQAIYDRYDIIKNPNGAINVDSLVNMLTNPAANQNSDLWE